MDASTVKGTAPKLCVLLSESDSILYTDFEFCEENLHVTL